MEILDTIDVWSLQKWVIPAIIVLLSVGVMTFKTWVDDESSGPSLVTALCCFGAFLILLILTFTGTFSYFDYTKYVIKVNENTTVYELYDKYDVINKQDYSNVFYVKDKTNEK